MNDYEKYCPFCDICGDRITDDYFLQIGNEKYHVDCVEKVSTDTYVENERMRQDAYIRKS